MSCGVCSPKAFRPAKGKCQIGYTAFGDLRSAAMGGAVPDLYFIGCELVLTDIAKPKVNLAHRPGFSALLKILRRGDRLLIDTPKSLGTKPHGAAKHIRAIERMGVEIMVLTDECEEMRRAA